MKARPLLRINYGSERMADKFAAGADIRRRAVVCVITRPKVAFPPKFSLRWIDFSEGDGTEVAGGANIRAIGTINAN